MIPFPGPRWCLLPEEIGAVDRAAIEAGLPGPSLMESAGRGLVEAILERWPDPGSVAILVGGGNNGGDGLVVARYLAGHGWEVELVLLVDPADLSGDAAVQWKLVEPMGIPLRRVEDPAAAREAVGGLGAAACVVDALLGTGLKGEVREPVRSAIEALDGLDVPIVAVDAPSGLDGVTGEVLGAAPRAEITVTFGFPKPGLFLGEGPGRVGRLRVAPLGYPPAALEAVGDRPLEWVGLEEAAAALPPRRHDLHKGAAGRLLILAGSTRFRGAARLTALAALRSGVGLCVVATPEPVAGELLEATPEAIVRGLPSTGEGALAPEAAEPLGDLAEESDAIAIGPGLTTGGGVHAAVVALLGAGKPTVLDADGLNVLAGDPSPAVREAATVLTPHPGELGRWLDRSPGDVDSDRVAAAREAAERWRAHVVLKGSPTVIAEPDGPAALNLSGNPGLATGGSGDVLTGLLGSLLAQRVDPGLAARAAPLLHGLAADWARADLGERGLVPSDLFAYLPLVVREISDGRGAAMLARIDHRYAGLLTAAGER